MKWSEIAADVGKAAPLLGTLLGGPAGATVGVLVSKALGVGNDPSAVLAGLANPDAEIKLKQIEADQSVELQKLVVSQAQNQLAAETSQLQAVNTTMQAEAKSDHWPTYTWRPAIGFGVAINTIAASVLVLGTFAAQILGAKEAAVAVAQLPTVLGALAAVSATALPILGVASYFRGKMQADPRVSSDNRG